MRKYWMSILLIKKKNNKMKGMKKKVDSLIRENVSKEIFFGPLN